MTITTMYIFRRLFWSMSSVLDPHRASGDGRAGFAAPQCKNDSRYEAPLGRCAWGGMGMCDGGAGLRYLWAL